MKSNELSRGYRYVTVGFLKNWSEPHKSPVTISKHGPFFGVGLTISILAHLNRPNAYVNDTPKFSKRKKQRNVIKVWEKWQPAQTLVSKGCKYLFSEAFLVNWCKLSSYVFASSMGALVPRVKPWFEFPYPNGDLEPVGLAGHKAMCNSHLEIQFNRNWLHPWRLTAGT